MIRDKNISVGIVQSVLDVYDDSIKDLCTHPRINKWSRWKPVNYNYPTVTSMALANYGFKNYTLLELRNAILRNASQPTDTYQIPTANYRLGDFRNYEHDAVQPLGNPSKVEITTEDNKTYWNITLEEFNQPAGSINLTNLAEINKQCLNALIIRFGASEQDEVVACAASIDNRNFKIDATYFPSGAYYISFYFSQSSDNQTYPTENWLRIRSCIPLDNALMVYIYRGSYDVDIYWMKMGSEFYTARDFYDNSTYYYHLVTSNQYSEDAALPPNYSIRCIFSGYPSAWYGEGKVGVLILNDIDDDEVIVGFKIVGGSLISGFWAAYTNDLLDGRGCFFEDDLREDDYIPIDETAEQKYIFQLNCHGYNDFDLQFGEVTYNEGDFIWHPIITDKYKLTINQFPQLKSHTSFKLYLDSGEYVTDSGVYGMDNNVHLYELKSN